MPKQDITGRAVSRAMARLGPIKARLQAEIPLGPNKAEVTQKEMLKNFQAATPAERQLLAASMGGTDTALEVLDGS